MERFQKEIEIARDKNNITYYLAQGINRTIENNYKELVIDDLPFVTNSQEKINDFKSQLERAGISEFIFSNTSTSLMDTVHFLDSNGIKIDGLATFNYENWYGNTETVKGFRMIVE